MSSPGYFYTDPNDPNAQQTQAKMAAMLLGKQQYNMQTPNSGLASAGSSLANAISYQAIQNKGMQNAYNSQPPVTKNLGDVNGVANNLTAKAPYIAPQNSASWLSNLFGMGGGGS